MVFFFFFCGGVVSVSARGEPLKREFIPFIAQTANLDPATTLLLNVAALKAILDGDASVVTPERLKRIDHQLKVLTDYQFADFLTIRELTANALDSYYHNQAFGPKDRKVWVTVENGALTIEDHGIGMSLQDIVFYLLTPTRSKNPFVRSAGDAKEGVTGRFGQGFFSIFSFLKKTTDRIVLETHIRDGVSYVLTFLLNEAGKLELTIDEREGKKPDSGTKIFITSSLLEGDQAGKPMGQYIESEVVRSYFRHAYRGQVFLNGDWVNPPEEPREKIVGADDNPLSAGSYVILGAAQDTQSKGQIYITVNGILICSIPVQGAYIYDGLVVDFPADTKLTQDRGGLDRWSEKNSAFIKKLIDRSVEKEDVRLLNTLEPLIGDSGFNLHEIPLRFKTQTLPLRKEILSVVRIHGAPVQFLAENIYKRAVEIKPVIKKVGGDAALFPAEFSDKGPTIRFFALENQYPVFFVDQSISVETPPFGKRTLNFLYEDWRMVQPEYVDREPFLVVRKNVVVGSSLESKEDPAKEQTRVAWQKRFAEPSAFTVLPWIISESMGEYVVSSKKSDTTFTLSLQKGGETMNMHFNTAIWGS